jgi:hypothetical protein
VDQIALPYRIVLAALLVLAALWFTVLKPGPVEAPKAPSTAPGVTGLGNAVKGAKGAVATANAAGAAGAADPTAEPAASGSPATAAAAPKAKAAAKAKPKPAAQARAAQDTGDDAAALLRDVGAGKVVVLAFLGNGSDDAAVRAGLRDVPSHGGRVVVRSAPVERIGRYAAITTGLEVVGTPTVVVLGKGPKARTLTGLTTTAELDQAVADMLAGSAR